MKTNQSVNEQSTDAVSEAAANAADPLQNIKAEFQRKTANLDDQTKRLEQQLAEMKTLMARMNAAPAATLTPGKKIEDVWFESPAEAARQIKEQATAEIRAELAAQNAVQVKQAQVLNQLVTDFPELGDQSSDLYSKAVEYYNAMPEDERTSPVAYKAAVKEAALDLGIKPKSKRNKGDPAAESFSLGGGSQGNRPAPSSKQDEARVALAKAFGLNVDDKMKERLAEHSKKGTRNWG